MLDLDRIRIDGGTQSRVELSQETVAEYAQAFQAGAEFPAVVVFFDGASYWLTDGFHRYFGALNAGESAIAAQVINGTQRDAVLYSLKANATHGLKRTNADKRKSVETLLKDAEWATWSDRKIAEVCGVGHPFVAAIRKPEVAAKQQENRVASATKKARVESDSTPAAPTLKAAEPVRAAAEPTAAPAEEVPEDDGPSEEEMAAHAAAEAADRELVSKLLESDQPLAALATENKQLKAEVAQLKLARDSYMNRANEAIALVKARDRQIAKLEKMLKAEA